MIQKLLAFIIFFSFVSLGKEGVVLEIVIPSNENWEIFLDESVDYLKRNWGINKSKEEYAQEMLERITEGGRLLFLLKDDKQCFGFVNAYIVEKGLDHKKTLYIAEFCILESFRRKGYGKYMFKMLLELPEVSEVEIVVAEVDKNRSGSNAFWRSVMTNFSYEGQRNLYWKIIK
jgi:ribosomal protein S18 acetylase RimI-like enzyme